MQNANTLKRNQIVTLVKDAKTSETQFKAGEQFKFLGWQGTLCKLSRLGDCRKLITMPETIDHTLQIEASTAVTVKQPESSKYDAPHTDESGASRRIVIATVLAGQDSGEVVMHMTPREYLSYCDGCAKMAEMYPG